MENAMTDRDAKSDRYQADLQPDPSLREGRSPTAWIWVVAIVLVAAIALTFAATMRDSQNASTQAAHNTPLPYGPSTKSPPTAQPTGRTTGSAPLSAPPTTPVR